MLEQFLNLGRKIIPRPIFNFFQPFYHWFLAVLACLYYRFPTRKLKIIGVTGTDGKTTTTILITSILKETGFKVGMINSLEFRIKDKIWPNKLGTTLPGRFQLQKLFFQMAKEKSDYVVLEVTSEGIAQHRILGINFTVTAFTNLSPEHLDFHKTFKKYRETKGKLFKKLKAKKTISIVNLDDENANYFLNFPADLKITYGIKKEADFRAKEIEFRSNSTEFTLSIRFIRKTGEMLQKEIKIILPLPGQYNIYNALAASAVAFALGVNLEKIKEGLERIKGVSGRMEEIKKGQNFRVFIDFAHTPQAMQAVFEAARKMNPQGRLISVFGSAGGRDKIKRPFMGEVAAKFTDFAILTSDDPRKENPGKICSQIEKGFKKLGKIEDKDYKIVIDRGKAIAEALEMAKKEDIVLILGMGSAQVMYVGEKSIAWNDRRETERLLEEKWRRTS